jgi:hypothetical protein
MARFLLSALLLGALQDPARVTFEKSGSCRALAEELSKAFRESVQVDKELEDKTVELKVKDAGFFQALDALCRAHGALTYVEEEFRDRKKREMVLRSGTWVDYPTSYWGHFKVQVASFIRLKTRSERGEKSWVRVELEVFHPPSLSVGYLEKFDITEALDGSGKDVRAQDEEPSELVRFEGSGGYLHSQSRETYFRDFDLAKGLGKLTGSISLDTARRVPVRVALDVGSKTETPAGAILVKSVEEIKTANGSRWMVVIKYEPRDPKPGRLNEPFESMVRFDDEQEHYESISRQGEVEIKTWNEGPRPKALFLIARADPAKVTLPFSFKDVVFKVD